MIWIQKIAEFWRRLASLPRRGRFDGDLEEEIRFHLDMKAEEYVALGMTPDEARRAARRQFGNETRLRERSRETWGFGPMETFIQDVRFGARVLARHKGFSAVAVLTLALGIGANTALFSVVNAVLLSPLPFPNAGRLVAITREDPRGGNPRGLISYPDFEDYRDQARSLEHVGAYSESYAWLTGEGGEPERVEGVYASADVFPALGVQAALGRTFTAEEDEQGARPVAVIGHGLWQRHFGSDPKVVGRDIVLDGQSTTVVGVMPADFNFPVRQEAWEFWVPLGSSDYGETLKNRMANNHSVVASLAPDATLEQARAELGVIRDRLAAQHPEAYAGVGIRVTELHRKLVGDVRQPLLILLGAVGFVLLTSCANVANLLLARAASRGKEIAVRTALGATRGRIIRQMLTESLLLSAVGGGAGLLLALWALPTLVAVNPGAIPRAAETGLSARVLLFTSAVSLLTGIIFGLAPALKASKLNLNESMKEGGRASTEGPGRSRVRGMLVASQIALSLVLLVGAGLLIKSFLTLLSTRPGYDPSHVLTAAVSVTRSGRPDPEQFFQEVTQRVGALPGVEAAGVTSLLPLGAYETNYEFTVEGRAAGPGEVPVARPMAVNADYFRAMQIPVRRGRALNEQDTRQSQKVVLVNEALARRYFGAEDPLGKRLILGNPHQAAEPAPHEIVGVVGDVRHKGLDAAASPEYYVPYTQTPTSRMYLVVRSATPDPEGLTASVRAAVREVDKGARIWDVRTMGGRVAASVSRQRFQTLLLSLFAALALTLAAAGVYGVMSYEVARRTHEIGIRMALGARGRDVLRMVVGQGVRPVAAGTAVGLAAALALTRLMAALLYGVSATDPLVFAAVPLLLAAVALLSCVGPARRAMRVDPIQALRYE